MHACTHTLHSVLPLWSTFHCHCVLMMCIATCVEVYCCVVMVLSLKCSSPPDWCDSIIYCLWEGSSSRSRISHCSKRGCQPSTSGWLFIYRIISNNSYKINFSCTIWLEYENYWIYRETGVVQIIEYKKNACKFSTLRKLISSYFSSYS